MKFSNPYFLIFLAALLFFFPFLGSVHLFDWDEINFAECAREMIETGNYLTVTIDYVPFHEKPPLFIWLQVLSMKIFGVNEFAARFPNAVCGIVTLLLLFCIGKKLKGERFGWLWVLAYAGSFLPHFYFKSGIIDPWFNLFIFLGVYFFFVRSQKSSAAPVVLSALFIGLAVLTKGPVAFLIFFITVLALWVVRRFTSIISLGHLVVFAAVFTLTGGSWYIYQFLSNGGTIVEFISYQYRLLTTEDSGHGGPFFYHVIVLLFGCFPASVFALSAFGKDQNGHSSSTLFRTWMAILFFVVLIIFSIVKTKIIHYSSLCYFPLSFYAAYAIDNQIGIPIILRLRSWLLAIIGILIGLALSLPPFIARFREKIIGSGIINDEFAIENLKANVHWSGFESLPGIIFSLGIIFSIVMMKKNILRAYIFLFALGLFTVNVVSLVIIPKIEPYTQGAAIEFFQGLRGKDVYLETLGYKSYAHLFYSDRKPQEQVSRDTLLSGVIDKPVYFSAKVTGGAEIAAQYPQLKELYRKNGFVFYVRE